MSYTLYFQRKESGEWCRDWTSSNRELIYRLLAGWNESNHRTIIVVS